MLITEYEKHVRATDQFSTRPISEREVIAIYGVVGEIGSLASAIKKQQKAAVSLELPARPSEDVIEELGDILWYCTALALASGVGLYELLSQDLRVLLDEIGSKNRRSKRIRKRLSVESRFMFAFGHKEFPPMGLLKFSNYQSLAFLTARTQGSLLLEVCVCVLTQLGAELLRRRLPESERFINRNVADRTPLVVLGEVFWHLAAIASLYEISLDEVAEKNSFKLSYLFDRGRPTELHDAGFPAGEQFPRVMVVRFEGKGPEAGMWLDGEQIGDTLTDNYHGEDGYRFHDVLHLANACILGWSPVLRKLLGRKRRSDVNFDRNEDGARAILVEELVVKYAHSFGQSLLLEQSPEKDPDMEMLFGRTGDFSHALWKHLRHLARGLEVEKNSFREWREATVVGHRLFHLIRSAGGGTVVADLASRSLTFK